MPELKHTFTGGKMEKDLDERIVPNGQYREALNIGVATSEDSDVGAAQNILGNIKVTEAIAGPKLKYLPCTIGASSINRYYGTNKHIAHTVDPQHNKLYRFISTNGYTGGGNLFSGKNHGVWMDRIVEYDTTAKIEDPWYEKERAVMVDIYKVATVIESIDVIDPPPPPPDIKWGCHEPAGGPPWQCVECDNPFNCNVGGSWVNDPTCGGTYCAT